jgi:hypothetical protein
MKHNKLQLPFRNRRLKNSLSKFGIATGFSLLALSTQAQTTFGISGNNLVNFDISSPATINTIGTFTGLQAGQMVVGLDFRPLT